MMAAVRLVVLSCAALLASCAVKSDDSSKSRQQLLPPAEDDIVATSFATLSLGPKASWIIVSEAEFEAALDQVPVEARDTQTMWVHDLELATAVVNDPWTPGVFASLSTESPEGLVEGRYWVVAGPGTGLDATGTWVIATNYKLAVIPLAINKPNWFGTNARGSKRALPGYETGRCCGEGRVCLGAGVPPVGPCGLSRCANEQDLEFAYVGPNSLLGWTQSLPRQIETKTWAAGIPMPSVFCLPKVLPGCLAGFGACGYGLEINTGTTFDVPHSTPTCTGTNIDRNVQGRTVPEICTYANYSSVKEQSLSPGRAGNGLPTAGCDGRCFGCEGSNGAVDALGRPPFCNVMTPVPGGGVCKSTDATRQIDQATAQTRFIAMGGHPARPATTRCDPPNTNGIRRCLTCETDGCRNTYALDWLTPGQGINDPCNWNPSCSPGTLVTGVLSPGAPLSFMLGSPMPSQPGTSRGLSPTQQVVTDHLPDVTASPPSNDPKPQPATGNLHEGNPASTDEPSPGQLTQQQPQLGADPVAMMSGSLEISHTDLSFAGPVRPLTFTRVYSSQSNDRSELGSNWTHNWDIRVIPLRRENLPRGVDPYCEGTPSDVTCVSLRNGGSITLYMKDLRDGLFKPQAGAFATIARVETGWALRTVDGAVQTFDLDGYLTYDADRFGNGFTLEYELNAWGRLDEAFCAPRLLQLNPTTGGWSHAQGPTGLGASSEACSLLAGLVGRTKPMMKSRVPWNDSLLPFSGSPSQELINARKLLANSQQGGIGNASVWGQRKKRVKRVTEHAAVAGAGRSLVFDYWPDSDITTVPGSNAIRRAGLLRSVTGPSGGVVDFEYRAPDLPDRLREVLLAMAGRRDESTALGAGVVAGASRRYEFTYPAGPLAASAIADLTTRYSNYFDLIYNCSYVRFDPCGNPLVPGFTHFAGEELERRIDAFRSEYADNIIRIDAPNEIVETQFQNEPRSLNWDRVIAQRWGSSTSGSSPAGAPWTTTLPQASLAYAEESADGTNAFLEPEIAARYGYEDVPWVTAQEADLKGLLLYPDSPVSTGFSSAGALTGGTPAAGTLPDGGALNPCNPRHEPRLRTWLPGYRRTYEYYALTLPPTPPTTAMNEGLLTPGVDLNMQLKRTKLTCGDLALAQTWDANHNDLQTTFTNYDRATNVFTEKSFLGRRAEMNLNANRICSWTRYTDRVGAVHVYGYNYHGRPLVAATKVGGSWRFAETLYNADGNVLSQRRVLPQTTPWSATQGDTLYGYLDGQFRGSQFSDTSPWYWSKRGNVTTILERPRGGSVDDEVPESLATTTSTARYTTISYEPLFSQVASIVTGDVTSGQRQVHRSTEILFDYQECSSSQCLVDLLRDAQRWGAQYPTDSDGNVLTTQNPLSVPLGYGDLNGDGHTGFPFRGTMVRVTTTGSGTSERTTYRFSPHGKPSFVQSADGDVTAFEYLPFGQLSGIGEANERGYLSRVRVMRNRSIAAENGPPSAPCVGLPGPYRWLLPATCATGDLANQLKTLGGVSTAIADEIVRQATVPDTGSATTLDYSAIGLPSVIRRADGAESRITRDVDGRVREEKLFESATQLHSRTVYTLNVQGLPVRIARFSRTDANLGVTVQTWDEAGNLRFRCSELVAGGCDGISHGSLPPGGSATTFWYDKEDRLTNEMDPEGAYTQYTRDERGWVTAIRRSTIGGDPGRTTTLSLHDDGHWLSRSQSLTGGAVLTTEARTFDGLGRLRSVTDTEGRVSSIKYSARDSVSSVSTAGSWTIRYVRDGLDRVTARQVNGVTTLNVQRTAGGRVWWRKALGLDPVYLAHDEFGRVVFERQGGVTTVRVAPEDRRFQGSARIRNEGRLATTSVEQTTDALGEVLREVEVGFSATSTPPTRTSSFVRNDNGFVTQTTDSLGATSEFIVNAFGWVQTQNQLVNTGSVRSTTFTYNRRGQLLSRTDPRAGFASTTQTYNGYGEPASRRVPGGTAAAQDVQSSWTYDAAGRLERQTMGTSALRFTYLNDRVSQVTSDTGTVLRTFGYDALGRINTATHNNNALSPWVTTAAERPVVATRTYDSLGRLQTETTKVGTRTVRTTTSTWALDVNSLWTRTVNRPDGTTAVEGLDALGRLAYLDRPFTARRSTYRYTGELEESETHATGSTSVERSLEWDEFAQLKRVAYARPSVAYEVSYQRDKEGRIVSENRRGVRSTEQRLFRGYKYQLGGALEQLLEASGNATPAGPVTDTSWASVVAAGATVSAQRFEYTRDIEGSPLSITRVDIAGQTPRFSAPARLRGFQLSNYQLDGSAAQGVSHDTAGRMTTEGVRTYSWDDFQLLVRAGATSGTDAQAFQYDAFGRLVAVRRGTTGWPIDEELAWDGSQMVAAWNNSQSLLWSALWRPGLDSLVSVKLPSSAEALALNDGRGSVSGYLLADGPSAGLWLSSSFSPEGRPSHTDWLSPASSCSESGTSRCPRPGGMPFGFHSAYSSPAHGLLYFRNRWYSSQAGQWLSQDPLGEVDSSNLYAFNRFDSVNFVDPLGLASKSFAENCAGAQTDCTALPYDPKPPTRDGHSETKGGGASPPPVRDLEYERARAETAEHNRNEARFAAGPVTIPPMPPPGPPPGPAPVTKGLDRFAPKPQKPPGGLGTRELAAEKVVEKLGTRGAIRLGLRVLGVVGTAVTIIEVGEAVGPPLIGIVNGQMAPEPAGTPGPDSATPEKPKPDHPSSEPGVPGTESPAPEINWDDFPAHGETPKGRPHTEHSRRRQEDRPGFTDERIDEIIDGDWKPHERTDEDGRRTFEYTDKRGNKVVLNDEGHIVTIHGPSDADNGQYH